MSSAFPEAALPSGPSPPLGESGTKEQQVTGRDDIGALYAEFGAELWRALLVVAGGRGDIAEEAVAEAFARYLAHQEGVRDARAWLYRTGARLVIAELRRQQRLGELADTPGHGTDVLVSDELAEAMARLTPEQRLVTFLAYRMDLPLSEVARLTGSTVAGVKMRLMRARRALRGALTGDAGA
jgi:RNA polymerase sigma-70 factor (ECF subfamily)